MRSGDEVSPSLRWASLAVLAATVSLPFLGKAFHIDDPFFLQISANVLDDWLNPFAGVIDWGGVRRPVWDLASNPPLLSYYLAPFLALGGGSEGVLHAAMLPFLLLLAGATYSLAARFTDSPWLVAWLVMTSAAVVVGVNLMRDVPATALGVGAVALVVAGTDEDRASWGWLGFGLAGLALLTRFNAIVFVAAAVLYPLVAGRKRGLAGVIVPIGMLAAYSLHNLLAYGEPQLLAQLGRGHNRPLHAWRENLAATFVVVGSISYLAPGLLLCSLQRRDRVALVGVPLFCAFVYGALRIHLGALADAQYWLWSMSGAALLGFVAREAAQGIRDAQAPEGRDALFLCAWLGGQLCLGVLVAPYPAVRHLLPALVPLTLLGMRYWERGGVRTGAAVAPVVLIIALQGSVSLAVAVADRDLANSHRAFAALVASEYAGVKTWFVGSWGWFYYAERAGLRQLHAGGADPQAGDILIVPHQVDRGVALARRPELTRRLRGVGEHPYASQSPFRTVDRSGAGFYALFSGRGTERLPDVPYRWLPGAVVERFDMYEVAPE